jgi:beta-lactamase class A
MLEANSITRRGMAGLMVSLCGVQRAGAAFAANAELEALERRAGGNLGVLAIEIDGDRTLAWRPDDRFLMCSTFKLLAAAATLARVDAHQEEMGRLIQYSAADLVEPHPVTGASVKAGALPLRTLCEAAVRESDSTAANVLMRRLGGPSALTAFMRSLGDGVTRVDRYELATNTPAGAWDTTSPRAMALSVRKLLFQGALQRGSRDRLEEWMRGDRRGAHRIRAGIPNTWVAGSKPGTSPTCTNDVAVLRPPRGGSPIVVAAYYRSAPARLERRETVLQQVGLAVGRWAMAS